MSSDKPETLLTTITRLATALLEHNAPDQLLQLLSLFCLFLILYQPAATQSAQSQPPPASTNPLAKVIGDLSKDGGPSPDTLLSLLPLLNSPQVKAKMNPATIAALMGMLNQPSGDKPAAGSPSTEEEKKNDNRNTAEDLVQRLVVNQQEEQTNGETDQPDQEEKKGVQRYLNWKANF